ncbi:MAG: hypothetical protein ACI4UJ_06590 [Candidatus Cryptobacteroides sp.]
MQPSQKDSSLMVTVVEFPEGYCWQRDSSGEAGGCLISLYCNGSRIVSVPSGAGYPACQAIDMHRCVDGKLYTDYSSAYETSVYENGNLLFSYEGREMICGFLVKDGNIYTLGQNRSGNGLSFRKNGILLYSSATGQVIGGVDNPSCRTGALYEDNDRIVFCFRNTSVSQGTAVTSCYIVRDGVPEKLSFPDNVKSVYDVRQIGGRIVAAVENVTTSKSPALIVDGNFKALPLSISNIKIGNCRLCWYGDENFFLNVTFSQDGWKSMRSALVRRDGYKVLFKSGESVSDIWIHGKDYACPIVTGDRISLIYTIGGERREVALEDGRFSMLSPSCMKFNGKSITAGLSPRDSSGFPIIVRGAKAEVLKVNGYVTSVGYTE